MNRRQRLTTLKHGQRYHFGDRVQVIAAPDSVHKHRRSTREALVMGSHQDMYRSMGPSWRGWQRYALLFETGGERAWYDEDELTLIQEEDLDTLEKWTGGQL